MTGRTATTVVMGVFLIAGLLAAVVTPSQQSGTGVVTLRVVDRGLDDQPIPAASVRVLDTNGGVIDEGTTDTNGEFPARPVPVPGTITLEYQKLGYVRRPERLAVSVTQGKRLVVGPLVNTKSTRAYYAQLGRNIEKTVRALPAGEKDRAAAQEFARVGELPQESQAVVNTSLSPDMRPYLALAQQNSPAQGQPGGGQQAPQQPMSFFVTSVGSGKGADLGGLAGADAHCQRLAQAVGAGNKTWRAYLSTQGPSAVNARDRIGSGPWFNARGQRIAQNVADLHGDTLDAARLGNNLTRATAFSEKNEPINGVGDTPNQHDTLTGSQTDGRAYTDNADHTCQNWTRSSSGTAQLGHHDRTGGGNTSWNSAHASRGCSQENLVSTGGAGLFYCFAID